MVISGRQSSMKNKRVAIYLRVSTSKQDTQNQLRELSAVGEGPDGVSGKYMRMLASAVRRVGTSVQGSMRC
jgi:predicted site-specific integrase-resolvase